MDAEITEPVVPAFRIVTCAKCQKKLKVPNNLMGKKIKCAGCGEIFSV